MKCDKCDGWRGEFCPCEDEARGNPVRDSKAWDLSDKPINIGSAGAKVYGAELQRLKEENKELRDRLSRGFWGTDIGRIMSYGIHEHNTGLGYIINDINFVKREFSSGIIDKDLENHLTRLKRGYDKCREAMDYVYSELKKGYEGTKTEGS